MANGARASKGAIAAAAIRRAHTQTWSGIPQ